MATENEGVGRVQVLDAVRPKWARWHLLPSAALWEAVCLSVNVEPTPSARDELARGHNVRNRFRSHRHVLPADAVERLDFCKRAMRAGGPLKPSGFVVSLFDAPVKLADVAQLLAEAGFTVTSEMTRVATEASGHAGSGAAEDGNDWLSSVRGYVVDLQRRGAFKSAKELFAAIERATGEDGSPFEKGSGTARGKLVVRATGAAIGDKTVSNRWKEIREAAK